MVLLDDVLKNNSEITFGGVFSNEGKKTGYWLIKYDSYPEGVITATGNFVLLSFRLYKK